MVPHLARSSHTVSWVLLAGAACARPPAPPAEPTRSTDIQQCIDRGWEDFERLRQLQRPRHAVEAEAYEDGGTLVYRGDCYTLHDWQSIYYVSEDKHGTWHVGVEIEWHRWVADAAPENRREVETVGDEEAKERLRLRRLQWNGD